MLIREQVSIHLDLNSFASLSVHCALGSEESWTLIRQHLAAPPGPLEPLLLRHLAIGPFLPTALGFRLCKVPIHRIEKLLRLFVCPVGVDDECEQGQPREEECEMRQEQVAEERVPVREAHPPHVVGEDHTTVECVDHEPLVDLPEQGVRPAGLRTKQTQR